MSEKPFEEQAWQIATDAIKNRQNVQYSACEKPTTEDITNAMINADEAGIPGVDDDFPYREVEAILDQLRDTLL